MGSEQSSEAESRPNDLNSSGRCPNPPPSSPPCLLAERAASQTSGVWDCGRERTEKALTMLLGEKKKSPSVLVSIPLMEVPVTAS